MQENCSIGCKAGSLSGDSYARGMYEYYIIYIYSIICVTPSQCINDLFVLALFPWSDERLLFVYNIHHSTSTLDRADCPLKYCFDQRQVKWPYFLFVYNIFPPKDPFLTPTANILESLLKRIAMFYNLFENSTIDFILRNFQQSAHFLTCFFWILFLFGFEEFCFAFRRKEIWPFTIIGSSQQANVLWNTHRLFRYELFFFPSLPFEHFFFLFSILVFVFWQTVSIIFVGPFSGFFFRLFAMPYR